MAGGPGGRRRAHGTLVTLRFETFAGILAMGVSQDYRPVPATPGGPRRRWHGSKLTMKHDLTDLASEVFGACWVNSARGKAPLGNGTGPQVLHRSPAVAESCVVYR